MLKDRPARGLNDLDAKELEALIISSGFMVDVLRGSVNDLEKKIQDVLALKSTYEMETNRRIAARC